METEQVYFWLGDHWRYLLKQNPLMIVKNVPKNLSAAPVSVTDDDRFFLWLLTLGNEKMLDKELYEELNKLQGPLSKKSIEYPTLWRLFLRLRNRHASTATYLNKIVDLLLERQWTSWEQVFGGSAAAFELCQYSSPKGDRKEWEYLKHIIDTAPQQYATTDLNQKTFLHTALESDNKDLVEWLLDFPLNGGIDSTGRNVYHWMALTVNFPIVSIQRLLDKEMASLSISDSNGHSPLEIAIGAGHDAIGKEIMQRLSTEELAKLLQANEADYVCALVQPTVVQTVESVMLPKSLLFPLMVINDMRATLEAFEERPDAAQFDRYWTIRDHLGWSAADYINQ